MKCRYTFFILQYVQPVQLVMAAAAALATGNSSGLLVVFSYSVGSKDSLVSLSYIIILALWDGPNKVHFKKKYTRTNTYIRQQKQK